VQLSLDAGLEHAAIVDQAVMELGLDDEKLRGSNLQQKADACLEALGAVAPLFPAALDVDTLFGGDEGKEAIVRAYHTNTTKFPNHTVGVPLAGSLYKNDSSFVPGDAGNPS
jgi:hypothetical protein